MFLSRNDKLDHLIELYNCLDYSNTHNLMENPEARELHCPILRSFLFNEIEDFSKTMMENIFEIDEFDFEFANKLYDFDKILFEKQIKSAIEEYLKKFNFHDILNTVSHFKYALQAIVSYEAIFEQIYDTSKQIDTTELYELSQKLQEFISKTLFAQLDDGTRSRLIKTAECLPIYPENLDKQTKIVVTNVGNKLHLNTARSMEKVSELIFPTFLMFNDTKTNWTIHHDRNKNLFEFESPCGLLLCWEKPLHRMMSRILPPEVILMKKSEAKNTKWKIQFIEEGNPSKGFTIQAAECDIYLCSARTGEFSLFLNIMYGVDVEEKELYAWKFHRIDYS